MVLKIGPFSQVHRATMSQYPPKMTLPHFDAYLRYQVQPTLWLIAALNNENTACEQASVASKVSYHVDSVNQKDYRNVATNLPNRDMYRYSLRIRVPCKINLKLNIKIQNSSSYKKVQFHGHMYSRWDNAVAISVISTFGRVYVVLAGIFIRGSFDWYWDICFHQ